MERLLKLKKSIYLDILKVIVTAIISIPIWLNFNMAFAEEIIDNSSNYIDYKYLNKASKDIKTVSDEYALANIETQDILVTNEHNVYDEYKLILKINKNTINKDNKIKLNINFDVNYLNEYESYEDNDYIYYLLDSNELNSSKYKYNISLWNDITSNDNIPNLDYELIVNA